MKRQAYLYFLLTFILGAVVGAAGMFSYTWYGGHWHQRLDRNYVIQHLTTELMLDDQQTAQLKQIMNDASQKYQVLHDQVRPQFEALRQQTDSQIRQILTPDQARKFDDLVRQWRANYMRK
jgi:hypothetical protein